MICQFCCRWFKNDDSFEELIEEHNKICKARKEYYNSWGLNKWLVVKNET